MSDITTVLNDSRMILLDFDGPTAHLFFAYPADVLADNFRLYLRGIDKSVPDRLVAPGPFKLYRWALSRHPELADDIESWLSTAETRAAKGAQPTPGCREMLRAARRVGQPVVIVSNNSEAAIRVYLDRHSLTPYVSGVTSRPHATPKRMKPDPWPILHTAMTHQLSPSDCVLIGDSVTDIEAANAAGSASIGYANKPGKAERLRNAGATTLIDDMHVAANAIQLSRVTAGQAHHG